MDTTTIWAGISWVEAVALAVFVLLVLAVGWTMFRKWSGRDESDVKGLRLGHHHNGPQG